MVRRRSLLIILVIAPALLVILALLFLNFADLSGWKDTVERLASDAIGRELRIDGEFKPQIGFATRVFATDVTLANADWSDDPHMLSVAHLTGEIDLLSILFGPITINDVEISGARVVFETDTDGHFNWALGDGEPSDESTGEFEMVIGHALVNDLELVYARRQGEPLAAVLDKLEFTDDGTGVLDLDLNGDLGGSPIAIAGRLGTFVGLINASRVEHDLQGHFADTSFTLRGVIGNLSSLAVVESHVSLTCPDLSAITGAFGIDATVAEPFAADMSVLETVAGSTFDIEASVGEMTANLNGTVDSLTSPGRLDVTIDSSGPDAARIGALLGVVDLPPEPFDISGRVRWEGFPVTCDSVEVRVGTNFLSANGVVGEPPLMLGTDFTFDGGGPDISSIAALAGFKLPRDSFSVAGRLVRREEGIAVEGVDLRIGPSTLEVSGTVGDPPQYSGTALSINGSGPNLAHFQDLAGIALPAEPFEISGKLVQGEAAIGLERVRARLGSNVLHVSGRLTTESDLAGTDLRLDAHGPNAAQLAAIVDVAGAPAEAFSVEGRVRVTPRGYRVDDLVASLGSLSATATGFVAPPPTLVGSDLQIHVEDPDISHPASIAGITNLPHDAFSFDTRLRIEDAGYRFDGFTSTVADMSLTADGLIGTPPELEGTQLEFTARGPSLASLNRYARQTELPAAPFSVAGGVRMIDGSYVLDQIVAGVGENRATANGIVSPSENLAGTDLEFQFDGPDLYKAGRLMVGLLELPDLPAEPYTLTGQVTVDSSGYDLRGVEGSLAAAVAKVDGRLGSPPGLFGTDLRIDIDGPDASLLTSLTGVTVPMAPFQLSGRVERHESGYRFHAVSARLGDHRAAVAGTLGELPKLIGTDLEIHVSGPDTNLYEAFAGIPNLPDKPFALDGRLSGTPERFSSRDFELTFGRSDMQGFFTVDITGKPTAEARLDSHILDLSQLRERFETAEDAAHETAKTQTTKKQKGALLFPDKPLSLEWLQAADADVAIRIDHLYLRANQLRDLAVDVHLEDGRLAIDRMTAAGRGDGRMSGSLLFEPYQDVHRLDADISIRQIRLDPPEAATQLLERPPIDIDIDLEAVGGTPHQLASSTNGAVQLVIGKGIFESSILDLVTADILFTLISAFNPFARDDPTTELECGVALMSFEDGIGKLEPMAFQSDKMTLLGDGKIDFRTEKLNLEWVTKPRKGVGISASMLTNPYIRLGGTLSAPSMQLKEAEAVLSTGAAVATMGLSLVAKGMFDRVTAEKKVCTKALEEIRRRADGSLEKSKN
jgi:uncharacterized protein involved in outer membrane biogenesis